uniref:DNA methylase N-4/N-6 domain-containing protein n=1 Tax=uncultured marine virus TaxID=186617 RepID=A0A0F7L8B0_9VIRU|nr:DNA methylase N-4/N-6 domain-containing protein [uncultured marine virus]
MATCGGMARSRAFTASEGLTVSHCIPARSPSPSTTASSAPAADPANWSSNPMEGHAAPLSPASACPPLKPAGTSALSPTTTAGTTCPPSFPNSATTPPTMKSASSEDSSNDHHRPHHPPHPDR